MSEDKVRRHVTVEGEVQGVFFRETVRRKAIEAGVAGWIENCSDGSVEAVFEGPAESVDELVEYCRSGPTAATVEKVDVQSEDPEGLSGFSVR